MANVTKCVAHGMVKVQHIEPIVRGHMTGQVIHQQHIVAKNLRQQVYFLQDDTEISVMHHSFFHKVRFAHSGRDEFFAVVCGWTVSVAVQSYCQGGIRQYSS